MSDFRRQSCFARPQIYPIGIPVLYAAILWKKRELLNPRIYIEPTEITGPVSSVNPVRNDGNASTKVSIASKSQAKANLSSQELRELEEKVEARREHPELVPSMFLWKDFGECCEFIPYLKTIRCGSSIVRSM